MKKFAENLGGVYRRYSDDMLFIVPGDETTALMLEKIATHYIRSTGSQIKIKSSKTQIFEFRKNLKSQDYRLCTGGKGKNGFEYLGFRYDGRSVYVRNSTLSNLQRKISFAARAAARNFAEKNPTLNADKLKKSFNYEVFEKRFGKLENWHDSKTDVRNWTFRTYLNRSIKQFGEIGKPMLRQFRNQRKFLKNQINRNLEKFALNK